MMKLRIVFMILFYKRLFNPKKHISLPCPVGWYTIHLSNISAKLRVDGIQILEKK